MLQSLQLFSPPADGVADAAPRVLQIVTELCREVRGGAGAPRSELDSNPERELGFDSLERAELLLRLEHAFDVRLPARTAATAETPRDLVRAVLSGAARSLVALRPVAAPRVAPASAIPDDATTLPEMLEWHARAHPQRTTLTLLAETDAGPSEQPLSCGDLLAEASRVAAGIAGRGIER